MSRHPRRSQPKAIASLMKSVLSDLGMESAARAFRVGEHWTEAVGPEIARHARPAGIRGGVLEVEVDSSVWCQQLQMNRREILTALRDVLGEEAPADLRFRVA